MLMKERSDLLKVVGAAAIWVSKTEVKSLSAEAIEAAERLSERLNALPEETLKDALDTIPA